MTTAFDDQRFEETQHVSATEQSTNSRMNFAPEVANRLLDLLSTDDAFRALFLKNPRAALQQVGHTTPESDRDIKGADPVLCCYSMKELASKEAIRAARTSLQIQLSTASFAYDMAL